MRDCKEGRIISRSEGTFLGPSNPFSASLIGLSDEPGAKPLFYWLADIKNI